VAMRTLSGECKLYIKPSPYASVELPRGKERYELCFVGIVKIARRTGSSTITIIHKALYNTVSFTALLNH
jgi:hypothetical protein